MELPKETTLYLIWGNGAGPCVVESYVPEQAIEFFLASCGMLSYDDPFSVVEVESMDTIAAVSSIIPRKSVQELIGHHKFEMRELEPSVQ